MPSTEEPRKTSTISSQIFELLKVGITLALTGLIGGKLMSFHNGLEELHNATPDKPPPDVKAMEKLYSSISQDTYGFYSEV